MGTPTRKSILDNVSTTLQTITTGNGFKTTVETVEAVGKGFGESGSGAKPFIGFYPDSESFAYFPGNEIEVSLTIGLICHIAGASQSARSSSLNDLLDDIIAVLSSDTTRGGKAIATTVTTVVTDEGSPDANGFGSMLITCVIKYLRNTSSS